MMKKTAISFILILSLILVGVSGPKRLDAAIILMEPEIVSDSGMGAGQKVTYDCIWFGSYPQTEIVDTPSRCGTNGRTSTSWASDEDYEWNPTLYEKLTKSTAWDADGDITIDDVRYRRIQRKDATYYSDTAEYYLWDDSESYHYFRYEPIKWRVLDISGNQALLLSDFVLDDQDFHPDWQYMTWANCTMRSWLNGYGSENNIAGRDFSADNFLDRAFSTQEQERIITSSLINENNSSYGTGGGEDTEDKVFLLSEAEVYHADESAAYGFSRDYTKTDEARRRKSTTYAKAMGIKVNNKEVPGNVSWWLRTPGKCTMISSDNYTNNTMIIKSDGSINLYGADTSPIYFSLSSGSNNSKTKGTYEGGICPAIRLDLSSQSLWSYAGTVTTDGSQNQQEHGHNLGNDTALYTVFYNANGGLKAPSTVTKTHGKPLTLSSTTPTREGYVFSGWARTDDAEVADFQPGDVYTENANLRLYAVWEKAIVKKKQTITASNKNISINSKPFKLEAKTNGDGKLIYSSSMKSVAIISSTGVITPKNYGKTIITIRAAETDTYQAATCSITLNVVPKKMTIIKAKASGKKTMVVTWKKDKSVTGYEVQLCMKKDFKKGILKRKYKKAVLKAKIKNLKSKIWYVRIRAYKTVGGKAYSGSWSTVKKVKVK